MTPQQLRKMNQSGWLLTLLVLVVVNPVAAQTTASNQISRAPRTVLISLPDRKLAVVENDTVIATFAVSVGAAHSPSPTGEFTIVNRVVQPTYYHQGTVVSPGKDNPVGTRWVGLSQKGYGIHGTNAPKSIGHAASHGCIRLRNRDMEKLFSLLRVGDVVSIRGERDEETTEIFGEEARTETVAEVATETAGVETASSF